MQRASRLLSKIKLPSARLSPEELAGALWPAAVGKRLALRTGPVRLFGRKLVVEVADAVWQSQLTTMSGQILTKLQGLSGPGMIDELEFRVGVPRRLPEVALEMDRAQDPADGIADPIFRQIYLASRRRSEREQSQQLRIIA